MKILQSLTPKQKRVLDYIESYTQKEGYSPSQQEIANHFEFKSLGTVQNYLVRLQQQGVIQKKWNARRSTQVLTPLSKNHLLPLLGRVAAGHPIEAIENPQEFEVPPDMIRGPGEHFILQVEGDSMIGEGIVEGDFVVIRKQSTAHNGQTVVALINNEATIKKFYKTPNGIELHSANPSYAPILVSLNNGPVDFKIEGVFVGLIRFS